jgi:hypothetical protein
MSSRSPAASSSTPQPAAKTPTSNGVRAGRPVGLDLREDLRERNFRDDDLGACRRLKLLAAFDKPTGDDIAGPRQDVDRDAIELLLRLGRQRQRGEQRGDCRRCHRQRSAKFRLHFIFLPLVALAFSTLFFTAQTAQAVRPRIP